VAKDRPWQLAGALAGVVLGGAVGLFAGRASTLPAPAAAALATVGTGSALALSAAPSAAFDPLAIPPATDTGWPRVSYAQQGEDLVVRNVFDALKIRTPTYIDIGAYHPFVGSNTYLFYRAGSRGVLVEPNPAFTDLLRAGRPEDEVLPIGIGTSKKDTEADYYVIRGPGQNNTFSKEQAEAIVKAQGPSAIVSVVKLKLRNVNSVLDEQFPAGGPDFFSIDIEGMDFAVLQTLDFSRHRPKVFCVEAGGSGGGKGEGDTARLMKSNGYVARGGNLINTVFVDQRLLP
jgi:FkbM family methyltransferase